MQIEIIIEAESEIIEAHNWYEVRRSGLGAEFELCVEAALEHIRSQPFLQPGWYRHIRRYVLQRFPYGVFYIVFKETIFIVAVSHLKRNPSKIKASTRTRLSSL